MPEFRWGRIQLEVPEDGFFVPYATFVADEYYFLDVGPNDVVIDAGAYGGDFPGKAAERARLVIAVEPDPGSVELLRRNVRGLGNVIVEEAALGEGPGAPAPADAGYRAIDEADAEKRALRNDDQGLKVHKFSSGALGEACALGRSGTGRSRS